MTDYIFTGETLDGKTVEGFYCKYQFNKDGLFLPAIQQIKEWDTGDYLEYIEVRPSSVRLNTEIICDQAEQIDNLKAEVERLRDENRLLDKLEVWCIENADHNPHVSNILDDLDNLRKPEQAKE